MDGTITLPWWALVAVLLLLLILLQAPVRQRIRRLLKGLAVRAAALRNVCERRSQRLSQRASIDLERYFTHLANLRLKLGLVDYEQLLRRQRHDVEALCAEARDLIAQLAEELQASATDVADAPQWVAAVQAVSELPAEHQRDATAEILQQVLETARHQHDEAMREYRWAAAVRHRTLAATRSLWRRLQRRVRALEDLLADIDRHSVALNMAAAHYVALRDAGAQRRVVGSVVLRFVMAALMLAVGLTMTVWSGELLYVELLMSGLSGAESRALVGAYTIALIVLGAVVSCALRWSTMLPAISALDIRPRRQALAAGLTALLLIGAAGMAGGAERIAAALLAVQWPLFATAVLSALLYASPLLIALQALVLEQLLRSGRPLVSVSAQRALLLAVFALDRLAGLLDRPDSDASAATPAEADDKASRADDGSRGE